MLIKHEQSLSAIIYNVVDTESSELAEKFAEKIKNVMSSFKKIDVLTNIIVVHCDDNKKVTFSKSFVCLNTKDKEFSLRIKPNDPYNEHYEVLKHLAIDDI